MSAKNKWCKVQYALNVRGTRVGEVSWWEWLNYANQSD